MVRHDDAAAAGAASAAARRTALGAHYVLFEVGLYVKNQIIYWIIARLPDYDNLVYAVDY